MNESDYQKLLQFGDQWLLLGLLTEADLRELGREYEGGEDKNTEHYRYGVFRKYLTSHRPLSPQMAEALYELGKVDPHPAMGGAMMHDIVNLEECPPEVLEKASNSGEDHLVKAVRRRRTLEEIRAGLTEDLFVRCLGSHDSVIHLGLLKSSELTPGQLKQLAEVGANRAVRNMAKEKLRSMHYLDRR